MNLGLAGSLEVQLALETVIQVGLGVFPPCSAEGAGRSGERWVHLWEVRVMGEGCQGPHLA